MVLARLTIGRESSRARYRERRNASREAAARIPTMAVANQDISSRNLSVEAWITIVLRRLPSMSMSSPTVSDRPRIRVLPDSNRREAIRLGSAQAGSPGGSMFKWPMGCPRSDSWV